MWVVNQLARRHPAEVDRLVRTVDRLRRPHRASPMQMRELIREHRRVLQALLAAARGLLGEAGVRPAPAVLSRISATLVGTAADPAGRRALRDGVVDDEPAAPGFDVLAGGPGSEVAKPELARGESRRGRSGPLERSVAVAEEDRAAARAREARRVAAAEMEEAERRARDLERAAAPHEHASREAIRRVAGLRARLQEAEGRAREEGESARQARRAAERARQDAERARARLASARQALGSEAPRE